MKNLILLFLVAFSGFQALSQCGSLDTNYLFIEGDSILCESDSVLLSAFPGESYLWNNGDTTSFLWVDQPGFYSVVIELNDSCIVASDTIEVSNGSLIFQPNIEDVILCSEDVFEQVDLFNNQQSNGISISWVTEGDFIGAPQFGNSNLIESFQANNNSTETLLTEVNINYNNSQCYNSSSFNIVVYPLPETSSIEDYYLCDGDLLPLIQFDQFGDTESIYWSISDSFGNDVESGLNSISNFSPSSGASVISYNYENVYGCLSDELFAEIIVVDIPEFEAFSDLNVCHGQIIEGRQINLIDDINNVNWNWLVTSDGLIGEGNGSTNLLPEFIGNNNSDSAIQCSIIVEAINGICPYTDSLNIVVNPMPIIDVQFLQNEICNGEELDLNVLSDSTGMFPFGTEVEWVASSNGTNVESLTGITQGSINLGVVFNDSYSASTVDFTLQPLSSYCEGELYSHQVIIKSSPNLVASSDVQICEGDIAQLTVVDINNAPNTLFEWNNESFLNLNYGESVLASPMTSTSFIVSSTDQITQCFDSDTVFVGVDERPSEAIYTDNDSGLCDGDSVSIYVDYNENYQYSWGGGEEGDVLIASQTGYYDCIISNGQCIVQSDDIYLEFNSIPVANIYFNEDNVLCSGEEIVLFSEPNSEWNWSTGQIGGSLIVDEAGEYSVFIIDENGCESEESVSVLIQDHSISDALIPELNQEYCIGDSVYLEVTYDETYSYLWSNNVQSYNQFVNTSGFYNCIISNDYCTKASNTVNVILQEIPESQLNISGDLVQCEGGMVTFTSTPGCDLEWSTGVFENQLSVTESQFVYVIATNDYGCVGDTSEVIEVTFIDLPIIEVLNGQSSYCVGELIQLEATGADEFYWIFDEEIDYEFDQNTWTSYIEETEQYSLIGVNGNICSDTIHGFIEVEITPDLELQDSLSICQSTSVELGIPSGDYNDVNWHGLFSSNSSNLLFEVVSSGYQVVNVESTNSCFYSDSVFINCIQPEEVSSILNGFECSNGISSFLFSPSYYSVETVETSGELLDIDGNLVTVIWNESGLNDLNVELADTFGCITSYSKEILINGLYPENIAIETLYEGSNTLIIYEEFDIINWGYDDVENTSIYVQVGSEMYCEYSDLNTLQNSYWVEYGNSLDCLNKQYYNFTLSGNEVEYRNKVYPNPFNDELYIELNNGISFVLINSLGQEIENYTLYSENITQELNLNHLSRGVYFIRIFDSSSSFVEEIKIIKQ